MASSSRNETRVDVEDDEMAPLTGTSPDVGNEDLQSRPGVNEATNVETVLRKQKLKDLEAFLKSPGDHNEEIRRKQLLHEIAGGKKDAFKFMTALLSVVDDETLFKKNNEGKTALHVAVENDRRNCCNVILMKNKETLTQIDNDGDTPLHCIVKGERNEICKSLVKYFTKETVNKANNDGYTPVHVAALERNPEIMKLLLDNKGNPQAVTKEYYTPLHLAAQSGSYKCIQLLLGAVRSSGDGERDQKNYLNVQTEEGMTALMFAAKQNLKRICQILIHTDVSLESSENKTALHYAAERNAVQVVECIVKGIESNASEEYVKEKLPFDDEKFSFLCLKASIEGKSGECFKYFLEKANEVTFSPDFVRQLVDLAATGSLKCVKSMCSRKEFQDYLGSYRCKKDNSLLHIAINAKSYGTAKALLRDLQFDTHFKNKNGDSPLHLLAGQSCRGNVEAREDFDEIVRELASSSHELVNSINANGETPLFFASRSGNDYIVEALLRKEPDVLRKNKFGKTAIHSAAENGRTKCLKLLLRSLDSEKLKQLRRRQQDSYPLHLASGKGHAQCCELLLTDGLVGKNAQENLWLTDLSGQYPVEKSFRGKHSDIFPRLLFKMEFAENKEEFSARLHRYFKKSLHCLSQNLNATDKKFYETVVEAVLESSWCKVAFDGRFCSDVHPTQRDGQGNRGADVKEEQRKPCRSFESLVEKYPDLACKAMDKHISQLDGSDNLEQHDYTPFEFIYYATEHGSAKSPFVVKSSPINSRDQPARPSDSGIESVLRNDAKTFDEVSWHADHPLQKAVQKRHVQVLRHKLTQSWLNKKLQYARWVLYPYFLLDFATAAVAVLLQMLFWNDHHLQTSFNGTTRHDIATVYGSDLSYNSSVEALVSDVRSTSANDSRCATWGTDLELLDPGSAAWNRTVCAIYHLEQKSALVIGLEVLQLLLILLHVFLEIRVFIKTKTIFNDIHRISRAYVRIPAMAFLFLGFRPCDFALGCRQIIIWQFEVVSVLLICVHVVLTLNKLPRFSGFLPVTPHLLGCYALSLLPLLFFLFAFSLTFHFLLMDISSFATVPYSLVKTLTLTLGDLNYDDTFVNDKYPAAYPVLSNVLFVVFIIGVGGILLNFIVGNPQEKLTELGYDDDLNRSIAHLDMHLFIDECIPRRRRQHACARTLRPKKLRSGLCVSSEMLNDSGVKKNKENMDYERLAHEVADIIRKDIEPMIKGPQS